MRTLKAILTTIAATAALALPAAAQEVTLRFHQMLPPQATIPARAIQPWIEKVQTESNGRIKVELYSAMQLGGTPPQLFDQAKDGVVDMIWTVLGYTPGRFPKAEAFELPFMVTNGEATSRAFQRYVEANAMDEFAGVKLIAVHAHGPGMFHSKNPITKLEDLSGLKVRGGSRVINDLLTKLGAEPIGMPVPAVTEALSKGVIDATTIPWEVTTALKVSELVKNHTGFEGTHGLYTQTFVVTMNEEAYNKLPDDLKAIIDANSGIETAGLFGRAMDEGDQVGLKVAQDAGNNIIMIGAEERARWEAVGKELIDAWVAATPNGQALYDSAVALVNEESAKLGKM